MGIFFLSIMPHVTSLHAWPFIFTINGSIKNSCCCGHQPNALFTLHCLVGLSSTMWKEPRAGAVPSASEGPLLCPQEQESYLLIISLKGEKEHTRAVIYFINALSLVQVSIEYWAAARYIVIKPFFLVFIQQEYPVLSFKKTVREFDLERGG